VSVTHLSELPCALLPNPVLLFRIKVFLAQLQRDLRFLKYFSPPLELTDQLQLSLAEVQVAHVLQSDRNH